VVGYAQKEGLAAAGVLTKKVSMLIWLGYSYNLYERLVRWRRRINGVSGDGGHLAYCSLL